MNEEANMANRQICKQANEKCKKNTDKSIKWHYCEWRINDFLKK